jgi:hypothetical protein
MALVPVPPHGLIAADVIRDRDILVLSQRGTMFSEPGPTCAPIDDLARYLEAVEAGNNAVGGDFKWRTRPEVAEFRNPAGPSGQSRGRQCSLYT